MLGAVAERGRPGVPGAPAGPMGEGKGGLLHAVRVDRRGGVLIHLCGCVVAVGLQNGVGHSDGVNADTPKGRGWGTRGRKPGVLGRVGGWRVVNPV